MSDLEKEQKVSDMEAYDAEVFEWLKLHGTGENKQLLMMTARHFSEWGRDHFREDTKMVEEDLEKAAEKYAENEMMSGLAECAFMDGANWQKKQMVDIGRASVIQGEDGNEIFFDDFKKVVGNTFKVGDRLEIKAIKHIDKWIQRK